MGRVKKEVEKIELEDYPKFGIKLKDEDNVKMIVNSNNKSDKNTLVHARNKGLERPILFSIESDIFDSYKFTNFAISADEARVLAKELLRMVDYLEN